MPRKKRSGASYSRLAPRREEYDTVIIVCEGTKTEIKYFQSLCHYYGLSSANIVITPAGRTDPMGIIGYALERMKDGEFDRGFCVFDRDQHDKYDEALQYLEQGELGRSGRLRAITSVPCFEFWLLLHFEYSTRTYKPTSTKSSGDQMERALKRHYRNYEKASASTFAETRSRLAHAMRNAANVGRHNLEVDSRDPSTLVHELVGYLIKLRT